MKNSHLCNIKFKKRQLARLLEVRDGISWSFNKVSHFDPYINLRAAIPKPITVKAHTTVPVPTGVTPELNSPNYKMQVTTVSKLAIEKGIIVLDSPATTSATTYSVKIGGNGSATVTVNFDERNTDGDTDTSICMSSITLYEVVAS